MNKIFNSEYNLEIRMLGGLQVCSADGEIQNFATRKAELLFAYLLLNPHRVFYRDALVERFFADEAASTGRKNLRTIIWQIRSVLEPKGVEPGTYLKVNNREVGFNGNSRYRLDCLEFKKVVEGNLQSVSKEGLASALKLYRGDFLEGYHQDWCESEREYLKLLYLNGVETLMSLHANAHSWPEAILLGEQIIAEDPLKEHIYRRLMRYYYALGDRPSALIKYQTCVSVLRDELDIVPMAKTMKLFRDIQNECVDCDSVKSVMSAPARQSTNANEHQEYLELARQLKKLDAKLALGLRIVQKMTARQ